MAFKNALIISTRLVMVVLIPSMVAARDLPETSSNSRADEDATKTNDQIKISGGVPVGVYVFDEANTAEESKINSGVDGRMGGAGHHIQFVCPKICCHTPWGCICC